MAQSEEQLEKGMPGHWFWPRRKRWRTLIIFFAIIFAGILLGWMTRERIATNVIEDQLQQLGLPATYEIGSIGADRQVLNNVVIGDPENPDFVIESVAVLLSYRLGTPAIGRVELYRPRLYGSYRDGELSFGTLDPVIFADSDEPAILPDLDLKLVDGRALIETDYGPVGLKAEGEGELDSGFDGVIAAIAPGLRFGDCSLGRTSAYGKIVTSGGEPRFAGPVRVREVDCGNVAKLATLNSEVDVRLEKTLDSPSGEFKLAATGFGAGGIEAESVTAEAMFKWQEDQINLSYQASAGQLSGYGTGFADLSADGFMRARDAFNRVEFETSLEGSDVVLKADLDAQLTSFEESLDGTLGKDIVARIRTGLRRELPGSDFRTDLTLRKTGKVLSGVVPSAVLRSARGNALLSLSQVSFSNAGEGALRVTGNLLTAGDELPRIRGRMERAPSGRIGLRLAMDEYRAGGGAIAMPAMVVTQAASGAVGFSGMVLADGPLPGGAVRGLNLPVSGNWSPTAGLAVWRECVTVGFDSLAFANLELDRRGIKLCPQRGGAIVRTSGNDVQIAAGTPSLDLAGRLADTPTRLQSGAVGMAWPGALSARDIEVSLGPATNASTFRISELDAQLGDEITGTFANADISLDAVPLDIAEANGNWAYVNSVLTLTDGAFRLLDREVEDRFKPLSARDATLTLHSNVIMARSELRNPESDRLVTIVDIAHDLSNGTGYADLDVPGLQFDPGLQPEDLTVNAKGIIALADGLVTGTGRIDWNEASITSTGQFSTGNLDFAAAFGSVKGARGTIVFDDLINLTTAPDQTLYVASINPGIEVTEGDVGFALRDGQLLSVTGGTWPFMGGQLILRPVTLNFAIEEERAYIFEIVGVDAGVFVEQLELGNLAARGIFDGTLPIVFDAQGNGRIEQGLLISRAPGGNLSYVGELTYEDLTPIANYAFSALRSLDFTQMRVEMDGPLTGEIITRLRFDGVKQGEGADSNFVTRRLAKIPLEFRVNIRADFFKLMTSVKTLYDPSAVRDPREVGLVSYDGTRLLRRKISEEEIETSLDPEDLIPDEPAIQEQESENMP